MTKFRVVTKVEKSCIQTRSISHDKNVTCGCDGHLHLESTHLCLHLHLYLVLGSKHFVK